MAIPLDHLVEFSLSLTDCNLGQEGVDVKGNEKKSISS